MPGFTALVNRKNEIIPSVKFRPKNEYQHETNYVHRIIIGSRFVIEQFTNPKFLNDKVFEENDDFIVGIEGVILNLTLLKKQLSAKCTFDLICEIYLAYDEQFIKELKGDFSGFIFDKKKNKWIVFTNQSSSKRIFYFENENYFIFSSEAKEISYLLSELNIDKELNVDAAYLLLTYGFMLEDYTLVKHIKRLNAGNLVMFDQNTVSTQEYFHLRNTPPTTETKEEIIDKMDMLFTEAIRLEFEKDKEYNYEHAATLSGGLDSRMTVLVANKLGYTDQLNFTFSQADYLDETIAKRIAVDYCHKFLFRSLDSGNYLKNIDKTVYFNDGLVLYSGSGHTFNAIEDINFTNYGIVHTGMLGDAIIGSYLSKPYPIKPSLEMGVHSTRLLHRIQPVFDSIKEKYESEELFKIYTRGFLGILNGNLYFDIFTQTASPFLDVDFLSYCYSIPEEYKYKQQIYLDWIAKKHPEFARYPWEKTGVSLLKSTSYKKYFCFNYYKRMSKKFFDRLSGKLKSGMNPFDFWLESNQELNNCLNDYFETNIELLTNYSELKKDCHTLYKQGNATDRFIVLTLLSAYKLHFT